MASKQLLLNQRAYHDLSSAIDRVKLACRKEMRSTSTQLGKNQKNSAGRPRKSTASKVTAPRSKRERALRVSAASEHSIFRNDDGQPIAIAPKSEENDFSAFNERTEYSPASIFERPSEAGDAEAGLDRFSFASEADDSGVDSGVGLVLGPCDNLPPFWHDEDNDSAHNRDSPACWALPLP